MQAFAQSDTVFAADAFASGPSGYDISKLILWGPNTQPKSAFKVSNQADAMGRSLTALSIDSAASAYSSYMTTEGLRTASALDYVFARPLKRGAGQRIVIEFDALWHRLSQNGESNRIVLTLMHDYPWTPPLFGSVDSATVENVFGRPAYNLRIRGSIRNGDTLRNASGFLLYGGGLDQRGETEKYTTPAGQRWWLPGFSSAPGGTSPGQGANYPFSPTRRNYGPLASDTAWRHFTWEILDREMTLNWRTTGTPPSANQQVLFMATPTLDGDTAAALSELNLKHSTRSVRLPVLYNYFDSFDALRVYFRASSFEGRTYLANLKVTKGPIPTVGVAESLESQIAIWPNPRQGNFNIQAPKNAQIILFDLAGKQHHIAVERQHGQFRVQTETLSNGLYYLRISVGGKKLVRPVVIQK